DTRFSAATAPDSYTLSLRDALPIDLLHPFGDHQVPFRQTRNNFDPTLAANAGFNRAALHLVAGRNQVHKALRPLLEQRLLRHHRSEEHTSELQSRENRVCRLLLEKK